MSDHMSYEFTSTHPLGARDSWPMTGPIYGLAERDEDMPRSRTLWEWLVTGPAETPRDIDDTANRAPVWY